MTGFLYYGRKGNTGVYELYRMPNEHMDPPARFKTMQRLRPSYAWVAVDGDAALYNEWLSGNFDFDDDRLDEITVDRIIADWKSRHVWPGRP